MTLADYIAANLSTPFAWGAWDCVHFAAGWAHVVTGRDYLEGMRGWKTEQGAARAIKRAGGLAAALDSRLNRIHPNLAKDGDVALYKGALCLFSGPHIVGPGPTGLIFIDRTEAECAWSY